MEGLDEMMKDVAKNVSEATDHLKSILSHTNQLKNLFRNTEELQSPETSVAAKKTAENVLKLIINNAKEPNEKETPNGISEETSFLEFKSNAEERICKADDIVTQFLNYID